MKTTLKEDFINNFIPSVKIMIEKEENHLNFLIKNNAPNNLIVESMQYYLHFSKRVKEYQEYVDKL